MVRRLAAILAADVVGYSSLMNADEAGTLAALKAHRKELFDPETERHGGRIFKLMGDGVLVEFPSVVEAVECALAIQRSLAASEGPIRLRIGINLGDVIADGDDIYGEGVNVAVRLEGLAAPGGICISTVVRESIGNRIDAGFADSGAHAVKGLPKPIRIWSWPAECVTRAATEPLGLPEKPSIAVLPFVNMSADPEQEFFSDGITEDIITALSRFDSLFVIARNSSFAYKGQRVDLKTVARELGVHFILEGSVRKAGKRVRVTAQLIDGQEGNHLWAERYDGALEDVFDLQEQVTSQVVGSIAPQIAAAEIARVRRGERVFDEAYELAWRAQRMYRSGLQQREPAMWDRAVALATEAVEKNPKCGLAYLIISEIHSMRSLWRWGDDPSAAADLAEHWAKKYFEQLPASYMAYYAIGQALWRKGNYRDALQYLRQAHELNANDSMVLNTLAVIEAGAGDTETAKAHALSAIRLNPKDPFNHPAYLALAMAAFIDGDPRFEEWVSRAIQLSPNAPIRRAMAIAHAANAGNQAMVNTHTEELRRISPNFVDSIFRGDNQVFQRPEHMEKLRDGLRKAGFHR